MPSYVNISPFYSGLEMSVLGEVPSLWGGGKAPSVYKSNREGGYSRMDCAFVWRTGIQADLVLAWHGEALGYCLGKDIVSRSGNRGEAGLSELKHSIRDYLSARLKS